MPRTASTSVENNFVNGLVTEATGLNFPENAVTNSLNVTFDEQGLVQTRGGIDAEPVVAYTPWPTESSAYSEFLWESVGGNGDLTLHVQQIGYRLYFYRVDASGVIGTNNVGVIELLGVATTTADVLQQYPCQFTSGNGYLFVSHPFTQPFYVEYLSNGTFLAQQILIFVRDVLGAGGFSPVRTTTPDSQKIYNLYNQGWITPRLNQFVAEVGTYPSDYDVWWLYKDADEAFKPGALITQVERGNSPAPKGSIIIDEFQQDRAALVDYPISLPVVTSGGNRPQATEFFAGRLFFAGVNYPTFNNKLYFSQSIQGKDQFGLCFQQNDPTSEFASDLLPTDGGVIVVPECGTIVRLWSVEGSLMIFATNGIWQLTGSNGIGFAANDYTVKKISSISSLSPTSFVDVGGLPMWWSADGIYTLSTNQAVGTTQVQSVSNDRVRKFLDTIPTESKKWVKGYFNIRERRVQWLYRDTDPTTVTQRYSFTHILNFNVLSKAFYLWRPVSSSVVIKGITVTAGRGSSLVTSSITNNAGDIITNSASEPVTIQAQQSVSISAQFKYVIATNSSSTTFAQENPDVFLDWSFLGVGVAYPHFLDSGYKIRGEAQRKWQANYVVIYTDNTKPSTYLIQGKWDYSTSVNTGRWSVPQRVQHLATDYKYVKRKHKIRGTGLALQFRIEGEAGAPFHLIGWSEFSTANGNL